MIDGQPSCKCNAKALDSLTKYECNLPDGTTQCVKPDNSTGDIKSWQEADRFYSASYGAQCEAQKEWGWSVCTNASTGEILLQPTADWCTKAWCYIDSCKCDTPDITPSSYFASHGLVDLKYSYATCGEIDTWTSGNTDNTIGQGAGCEVEMAGAFSFQLGGFSMLLLAVTML